MAAAMHRRVGASALAALTLLVGMPARTAPAAPAATPEAVVLLHTCPADVLAQALAAPPAPQLDREWQGHYQVGDFSADVSPVRMAYEVLWAGWKRAVPFFLEGQTADGLDAFSAGEASARQLFLFRPGDYRVGVYINSKGNCLPVLKLTGA